MKFRPSRFSTLLIEIFLTLCICMVIILGSLTNLKTETLGFSDNVNSQYQALTNGYVSTFRAIAVLVRDEINKDVSFEEMDRFLKAHESQFRNAVGADVYDGVYLTYKNGYAHSWTYGDYSRYDPETRAWYQAAKAAKGKAVIVAPYDSYLASSNQQTPNSMNVSVAQQFASTTALGMDLKLTGVNRLLENLQLPYAGTLVLFCDPAGNILSANDKQYYVHRINQADTVVSEELRDSIANALESSSYGSLHYIEGTYRMVYVMPQRNGNMCCVLIPLWGVAVHNFLIILLITAILILLEITIYMVNNRRLALLDQRNRRMTAITDAAFAEQYYVDLATMEMDGSHDDNSYLSVYNRYLPNISGDISKVKFQSVFSPDVLRHAEEKGLTAVRVPVNVKNKDGIRERRIIEFGVIVSRGEPGKGKNATILINDVTEDEKHNLMILQSLAAHYTWVYMGNIRTRYYEAIKVDKKDAAIDAWNPATTAKNIQPAYREAFLSAVSFDKIESWLQHEDTCTLPVAFSDGHWYLVQVIRALTYEENGDFFVCFENADEQMRHQKELEEALVKAHSADKAKSDFLSRMSHDIRTPLNGIMGMTAIARERNHDAEVGKCLETIQTSGQFLLRLINDILDVVKIESGKFTLQEKPAMLSELNAMVDAVVRPIMKEKNLTFTYQMDVKNKYANIDLGRFGQICFNLLSNAAKFTHPGGSVLFSITSLREDGTTEWIRIIVKDTGIGMKAAFVEHAFQPFEQESHGNDSQQWKGTGLGLAITKQLTEMMGGTIAIDSEPGKGTTFTIDMPIKGCARPERETDTDTVPDAVFQGKTVLLAEDNEINMIVAKTMLEDKGMHVVCAPNGGEAVALFKVEESRIDVILMDVMMPVMNGIEATRAIRAMDDNKARTVPIIAATANAFTDDVQACLEAGMNGHVAKPIEPDVLFRTIGKFL